MARQNLLLISYLFPPAGGIAVQRALSLARYLPDCGYQVHVLKAANAALPVHDPSLLRHIPASVQVHGAFTPEIPFALRQKLWHKLRGGGAAGNGKAGAAPVKPSWWKRAAVNQARRAVCPGPEIRWVRVGVCMAWRWVREF